MRALTKVLIRTAALTAALWFCQFPGLACYSSTTTSVNWDDDTSCDTDSDTDADTDEDTSTDSYYDDDDSIDGGPGIVDAGGLVCVFDIDSTLTCERSCEAVTACKHMGALLGINTAQSQATALSNKEGTGYIDWAALGFPTNGAALDMEHGAFIFGACSESGSCSEEFGGAPGDCDMCNDCGPECPDSYMGKAYGMSRIADYYGVSDKECIILFDDLTSNTEKVELFGYSSYYKGSCSAGWNYDGVYEEILKFLESEDFAHCFK